MGKTLSTGAILSIAKTYGTSSNMTAITNATEAVATLAAGHGVVAGDYLEVTSGWGLLNAMIVRAKTVSTNDVTLEGIATTDTTKYPAGSGTGSIRRITAWDAMSQVKNLSRSGGEQKWADATALEDVVETQMPTTRGAISMSIDVFDDPTLAWYSSVQTASDAGTPYAFRIALKSGAKVVANAYWSLMDVPDIQRDQILTTNIALSFAAKPKRYAT
jgi:hypothetical protein